MKRILLLLLIGFFSISVANADQTKKKHPHGAKSTTHKIHCPNRPGCICQ